MTRGLATSLPRHGQVKLTPTMSRMTTPISHWDAPGMGMAAHPGPSIMNKYTNRLYGMKIIEMKLI